MNKTYQKSRLFLILAFALLQFNFVQAQSVENPDYTKAVSFLWQNINNKVVFNTQINAQWFSDGSGLWFVYNEPKGKTFMKVNLPKGNKQPLFDHNKVAESLSNLLDENVQPFDLPFNSIKYIDKERIEFNIKKETYILNIKSSKLKLNTEKEIAEDPFQSISPNGKWVAYSENYNLFIKSTENKTVIALSTDGKKHFEYASWLGWYDLMTGENGDRPKRFFARWSDDSKYLMTNIVDSRYAEKMYLLDWSIDSLFKPKLLSYYRGSPGDTTMVHIIPKLYNITAREEIKTKLPRNTHINSTSVSWADKPGFVYASFPDRGFQKTTVLKINLETGVHDELLVETSTTNIDKFDYEVLEDKQILVFTSERNGWNQIYKLNMSDKKITKLTQGDFFVNEIKTIDKDKGIIYFMGSGKEIDNNPYHQQLYKVDLKGNMTLLTPELKHHIVNIDPENEYFIDNISTATTPTKTVLRKLKNGKIISTISEANVDGLLKQNWKAPQIFEALGRDGKTKIYGALWKPTNFDPNKKYPIIDHSYTGPHTQMFPKDFRRVLSLNNQPLAELGFIVMMVDGMGTTGRSKAFRNVSYKNMGKNLLDHKLAIEQLSEKFSWIDSEKVGIFGHSAGGYDAAHAVLEFPEFYKVAVSSSADHDFRMEKAWWPEMYMGWPVDKKYHEVSNITMAGNLKGKLLLVHGGLDDNVNPSATFKLSEALIKADKEFDLIIMPSQRHGYRGDHQRYFLKKRWNYFVEHLLGKTPKWNFNWE